MAQSSFPFENVDTTEVQFSQWARHINEGIRPDFANELEVFADDSGLNVTVRSGQAMVRGHYYASTAEETLTITTPDATNPRIDSVVLELDIVANSILLKVLAGTPDASPVAPTLTQSEDGNVYQLLLANVDVAAGVFSIEADDVTDLRTYMFQGVGKWTTATRPENPIDYQTIGYNTDLNTHEVWNGSAWTSVFAPITTEGDLAIGDNTGTAVRLPIGAADTVLTSNGTTAVWAEASGGGGGSVLDKADYFSVIFTKTGNDTAEIKAGTSTTVGGSTVEFATDTAITMPSLTAGTDYFVYAIDDGTAEAVAATGTWPNPVASPPANSRLIGGFHYAPGGNATGQSGGDTTPQINEYSFWDLKFRPSANDPRGMTLVSDAFWVDIYLLNTDPQTNGTSKYNVTIADGSDPAIIPDAFGGNGSATYSGQAWWNTSEALSAFGKRCISVREASVAFYGTTEESSAGSDPNSTILREAYTSRWGVMLSTGNMLQWGNEFGGGAGTSSDEPITGGRGSVTLQANAVVLGGYWNSGSSSGSRSASWTNGPSSSGATRGGRGACDHLLLV